MSIKQQATEFIVEPKFVIPISAEYRMSYALLTDCHNLSKPTLCWSC